MELRPPQTDIRMSHYWSPMHVTEGADQYLELPANTEATEIAKILPERYCGFFIGTHVEIDFIVDDEVVKTIYEQTGDGNLYLPKERCEIIDMNVIQEKCPNLLPFMLEEGLTTALDVTGGYIAYNPNFQKLI